MIKIAGIVLAILAGHACAAGRSTLDEMPAPARSTFVHAYLDDDDPDKYSELFLEPAVIDKLPGAIVTLRVNDGKEVQQEQHRFFLSANEAALCNEDGSILKHAFGGKVVGEEKWHVAQPTAWNDDRRPSRRYAEGTAPIDIIGTELCLVHFAVFADDLHERTTALMEERTRKSEERSAAKQARHDADVIALRGCLRDQDAIARVTESDERQTRELNSVTDRLDITRAGLEVQKKIIESYEASASSRNEYQRQAQAFRASTSDHERKLKAHARVLERHRTDFDRFDAACVTGREFAGSAVHEVCRTNDSAFCTEAKSRR